MTLEEKYRKAVEALREIADRRRGQYDYCGDSLDYLDGYVSGLSSAVYVAEDALSAIGEKVTK